MRQCLHFIFLSAGGPFPQGSGAVLHVLLVTGLHLSLLVLWVRLAVDEPAPAPLHPVAVPAALLDDALGLEPQGKPQAGQQVAAQPRGPPRPGLRTSGACNAQGSGQESGERAGRRRGRPATEQGAQGARQQPRHKHGRHAAPSLGGQKSGP